MNFNPSVDAFGEVAASAVETPAAVIDHSVLDMLRELGDASFLAELVNDYLNSNGPYLEAIDQAVATNDLDTLYKTAHTMKSASANMGANTLAEICKQLENAGRSGNVAAVAPLLRDLHTHYVEVEAALRNEVL